MSCGIGWWLSIGVNMPARAMARPRRAMEEMLRAPTKGAVMAHAEVRHSTSRNVLIVAALKGRSPSGPMAEPMFEPTPALADQVGYRVEQVGGVVDHRAQHPPAREQQDEG